MTAIRSSDTPWRVALAALVLAVAMAGHLLDIPGARAAILAWASFLLALVILYTALVTSSRRNLANEGERLLRARVSRHEELFANLLRGATVGLLVFTDGLPAAAMLTAAIGAAGLVGCVAKDAYRATLGSPAHP